MVIFDKISNCNNVPLVNYFINRYYEITNLNYNSSIDSYNKKNIAKAIDDILSGSSDYLTRNNYKTPYKNTSLQELSKIIEKQAQRKIFYSNKQLTNAIQEVHNRFATKLGTPAVFIEKQKANDFVMCLTKMYDFNRNQIINEENVKITYAKKSRSNVSFFTILHETKHSQQNYSLYKLVNGATLNNAEKVSAYFSLHGTYSELDEVFNSPDFSMLGISDEKISYERDFAEIDANIYAINTLEKLAEKGLVKLTLIEFLQINLQKFNIIKNFCYNRTVKDNKFFEAVKEKMQLTINRLIKDVNSLNNCSISKSSLENIPLKANELLLLAKQELDEHDFNFFKKNIVKDLLNEPKVNEKINKASKFIAKEINNLSFDSYFDFLEKTVFKYYMDLQVIVHDFEKSNGIEINVFSGEGIKLSQEDFELIICDAYAQRELSESNEQILTK